MKNKNDVTDPVALNAEQFMMAVIAATPPILRQIDGIVNVDMRLSIDETGATTASAVLACKTIVGKPIHPQEPEIVRAADSVGRILRFKPAMRGGVPVPFELDMSFGFTTTALENSGKMQPLAAMLN